MKLLQKGGFKVVDGLLVDKSSERGAKSKRGGGSSDSEGGHDNPAADIDVEANGEAAPQIDDDDGVQSMTSECPSIIEDEAALDKWINQQRDDVCSN